MMITSPFKIIRRNTQNKEGDPVIRGRPLLVNIKTVGMVC